MNEWILQHLADGGLIVAGFWLIKWLMGDKIRRNEQVSLDHESRLRHLENSRVTRDDLDELRMSLTASITNVGERTETYMRDLRNERVSMHKENQDQLTMIIDTIVRNEERSAKTRHDTKDEVHTLALKIAEMNLKTRGSHGG